MSRIILDYDNILIRDLGFRDWEDWEPMISEVSKVLGEVSLKQLFLTEAKQDPGKEIVEALIDGWTAKRGYYWRRLVEIRKNNITTPYEDRIEYKIYVKTLGDLLTELSGSEIYHHHDHLREIFESEDYQTLRKLGGIKIII